MSNFLTKRKERFLNWWSEPTNTRDRVTSAFLGFWAGIWLGGLGRIIYSTPVSGMTVLYFALGGALICSLLGASAPKHTRIIFIPFAFFQIGG